MTNNVDPENEKDQTAPEKDSVDPDQTAPKNNKATMMNGWYRVKLLWLFGDTKF